MGKPEKAQESRAFTSRLSTQRWPIYPRGTKQLASNPCRDRGSARTHGTSEHGKSMGLSLAGLRRSFCLFKQFGHVFWDGWNIFKLPQSLLCYFRGSSNSMHVKGRFCMVRLFYLGVQYHYCTGSSIKYHLVMQADRPTQCVQCLSLYCTSVRG